MQILGVGSSTETAGGVNSPARCHLNHRRRRGVWQVYIIGRAPVKQWQTKDVSSVERRLQRTTHDAQTWLTHICNFCKWLFQICVSKSRQWEWDNKCCCSKAFKLIYYSKWTLYACVCVCVGVYVFVCVSLLSWCLTSVGDQVSVTGCQWRPGLGASGDLDWVPVETWTGCQWRPGLGASGDLDWVPVETWTGCQWTIWQLQGLCAC